MQVPHNTVGLHSNIPIWSWESHPLLLLRAYSSCLFTIQSSLKKIKLYLFERQRDWERNRFQISIDLFPQCLQQPGLNEAITRVWELKHGRHAHNQFSHNLLPSKGYMSRKVEMKGSQNLHSGFPLWDAGIPSGFLNTMSDACLYQLILTLFSHMILFRLPNFIVNLTSQEQIF